MPTPSEVTGRHTPPLEATSSRASFTSCPPDEDRDQRAPLEAGIDSPLPISDDSHATTSEERVITQEPTPELDAQPGMSATPRSVALDTSEKGEHVEDVGIVGEEVQHLVGSPDTPSESEARLARSMSKADISAISLPRYLTFPRNTDRQLPTTTSSFLRPGSKFRGTQQSDRQVYDVQVEIKDVDMAESFLCGYLRIQGLTDDHPTLTTFFEGEIIGSKHLFKTTHPSWGSSEKVDLQHWARFPAWRPLAKSAISPHFTLKNYQQREHLFMRWKEYFLVPDHRVKTITGASFEGFYYICFNQGSGSVSGIYFHAKSEKYQQLELRHVDDNGCMGAMEFR